MSHKMRVRFRTLEGEEFTIVRTVPAFTERVIERAIEHFLYGEIEVELDGDTVYAMDMQTEVRRWLCNYGLELGNGPFFIPYLKRK